MFCLLTYVARYATINHRNDGDTGDGEMTKQEIIEAMWEASNGLSMGWQAANVKDDEARNRMQAPINAGQEAILSAIRFLEQE